MTPASGVTEVVQENAGGIGWPEGATLLAAAIAAIIAVIGYTVQRKVARRTERADLYAKAIGAVEAYLEGPYRIRRKIDDPANWFALSSSLSDAKTAISHHVALLEMHAPVSVQTTYDAFVKAALRDAGPQMTDAWHKNPITSHHDIPLGAGYERAGADAARDKVVEAMSADLRQVGTWWRLTR